MGSHGTITTCHSCEGIVVSRFRPVAFLDQAMAPRQTESFCRSVLGLGVGEEASVDVWVRGLVAMAGAGAAQIRVPPLRAVGVEVGSSLHGSP